MTQERYYQEQVIGGATDLINQNRVHEMNELLIKNFNQQSTLLQQQDLNFVKAMNEVNKVREFVGNPQNILGSNLTKHGEVAESLEVNIRNARDVLEGKVKVATFEGVGRTAPQDYLINHVKIQSKFYNGINKTLNHGVLEHMEKYSNFGRDGSYYQIPKDQYEAIKKVMQGDEVTGLAQRTIDKIRETVSTIELKSSQPFTQVVQPSISNYDEVQLAVVNKTIDGHEEILELKHEELKGTIETQSEAQRKTIELEHSPSLEEGLKVASIGAALGGVSSVVLNIYQKKKHGKSIASFTQDDWKSIGVDFSKGAINGAVTGGAVYTITNYTDIGAPIASAMVSASFGIATLSNAYQKGEISQSEYINQGQLLCLDSGAVVLSAIAGQALIPIPIVGALVGTHATKIFMETSKKHLDRKTTEIQSLLNKEYSEVMARFDVHHQKLINDITQEYDKIGGIMEMAFNFEMNNAVLNLNASIQLAELNNVNKNKILQTDEDFEDFFLS